MSVFEKCKYIGNSIVDFLFPYRCPVCGERASQDERPLCLKCNVHMPRTHFSSDPHNNNMALEYAMLRNIDKVGALFLFRPGSDYAKIVYDMKYHEAMSLCESMGRIMAQEYMECGFFEGVDAIIPLPLSVKRKWHRGYNQSEYLARGISKVTGIPVVRHVLLRKDFKESQTRLSRVERRTNVEGVFMIADAEHLKDKHILLVDDVITTGATTKSCIAELQKAENVRISILSLCYAGKM